jgi:N-acetylglutamate synthase-like GNAT family acetyltransferase
MDADESGIRLRQATVDDEPFLRTLHREAMGPYVEAAWGSWDPDVQEERFRKAPVSDHQIVLLDGTAIGCLLVQREDDAVILSRIWITPNAQGRGVGTQLITRICDDADRDDLPVKLRVLKINRAQRLYRRLGFEIVHETDTHLVMLRRAM